MPSSSDAWANVRIRRRAGLADACGVLLPLKGGRITCYQASLSSAQMLLRFLRL